MHLEPDPTVTHVTDRNAEKLRQGHQNTGLMCNIRDRRCEASFRRVYEYYTPRVNAFLRQKGVAERISQEMTQEIMTRVWLKASLFDERKANVSTWIFTIARNAFIDRVRKLKRADIDLNDPLLVPDNDPAPDAGLDSTERSDALKAAINALPEEQSDVLRLVYFNGMKQQAVAEKLSVPLNTVKSRLRLALEKLRRLVEHA